MNDVPLTGDTLPRVRAPLPGERSLAFVEQLAQHECPGLTARRRRRHELSGASHDPIVWHDARGANVRDVDGNLYVDLTAGFGAALIGHTHPTVVSAVHTQATRLLHALGDVYPSASKVALEARLAAMAPWPDARVMLGLSGADAIEAALKTVRLYTRRSGVLAFEGGYHGLSYGAVAVCGYKQAFRVPFEGQLNENVWFAPYPSARVDGSTELCLDVVEQVLATGEVGAVVMEPILGRGGVALAHQGALREVAARAHATGALVIADEIYTGLGRTGARFRSVADGVDADIICLGKALGGGVAVSACLMRDEVARSWGECVGEAIHTSTFLGNPLACAAAMASLDVLEHETTRDEMARAAATLARVLHRVASRPGSTVRTVTCAGLLAGVTLDGGLPRVLATVRAMLERGYLVLPGGVAGDGLTFTPPCCITDAQLEAFGEALIEVTTSAL